MSIQQEATVTDSREECARVTGDLLRSRLAGTRAINMKKCQICDKAFASKERRTVCCSKRCGVILGHRKKPGRSESKCRQCGSTIEARAKFCSYACDQQHRYETYITNWKSGSESGNAGAQGISAFVRRYLFEQHDGKCQKCGWCEVNQTTGKVPLTVNHIDGNYRNSGPENLELLCPNCHSLTSNYGVLNTGFGRKGRHAKPNAGV